MRFNVAYILAPCWIALAHAQEHGHEHPQMHKTASNNPLITITINPEARVSVMRTGDPPPSASCGTALELPVKLLNQAFVTFSLEATLVDSIPNVAAIEFPVEPLVGTREESRVLRLTLRKPGDADVTISFHAKNDVPDLGGRDRVHLLLHCS